MKEHELNAVLSKHGVDKKLIDLSGSYEQRTDIPVEASRAIMAYLASHQMERDHVKRNVLHWQERNEVRMRAKLSRAATEQQMNQSPFGHIAFNQAGELVKL